MHYPTNLPDALAALAGATVTTEAGLDFRVNDNTDGNLLEVEVYADRGSTFIGSFEAACDSWQDSDERAAVAAADMASGL